MNLKFELMEVIDDLWVVLPIGKDVTLCYETYVGDIEPAIEWLEERGVVVERNAFSMMRLIRYPSDDVLFEFRMRFG